MLPIKENPLRRPIVPKELGGKWIAWNAQGNAIIASGLTLPDVIAAAKELGEEDPSFEKVPPPDVCVVGAIR